MQSRFRLPLLFQLALFVYSLAAVAAERPNVLIILVDDLGFSDLGFQGGEIDTPNIDRLAADGLTFSQFYNAARCGPTRASIMTGLYSHQVGVYELEPVEPGNNIFLSELLALNGYQTYMSGKWHLGNTPERLPPARGFDHSYAYQGCCGDYWEPPLYVLESPDVEPIEYAEGDFHATDATTDYAVKFLQRHQGKAVGSDPFFLYLAYQAPHSPIQAPKHLIDKYVARYEKGWDRIRQDRWKAVKEKGWFPQYKTVPPFSDSPPWHDEYAQPEPIRKWNSLNKVQKADQARRMATYAAMVDQVDQGVGKTIAQIERMGELENTLIFFLSDNGANYEGGPDGRDGPLKGRALANMGQPGTKHHLGSSWAALCNTPLRLYKHFNHEGGILTPFIAHWPNGIERSGNESQRGHVIDFMATIVDIAGIDYPDRFDGNSILPLEGTSLVPAFNGRELPTRTLFFEHEANRAVLKGDYKLVSKNFTSTDGQTHHDWELYNIANDPLEQNDLASQHYYDKVIPLAREWHQWATRTDAIVGYEKWMLKLQHYWQTGSRTYLDDAF